MPVNNLLRQRIAFWICAALLVALLYSKFILTLGMIALLLLAFTEEHSQKLKLVSGSTLKTRWHTFKQRKDLLVITLFFFIVLCTGIYSSDLNYWGERIRIKLPFLILPFAFASLPAFTKRQYLSLIYGFFLLMTLSTIPVVFNYVFNFEDINQSIARGKAIPTPINHIRYSLFCAFALLSGLTLWWRSFYWKTPHEKWLSLGASIYLFLFLHLLSVRSGLVVLYLSTLLIGVRYIFYSRRFLLGSIFVLCLAGLPFLAYHTIPSLQQKIRYSLYDMDQYRKGNIANLSDSERLISIQAGLALAQKNIWVGLGAGDLKKEIKKYYNTNHPQISHPKLPHNQLISVLAGTGVIGLALFLFAFFYPLSYKYNYKNEFLLLLYLIIFCSFFVENTIENAIGVAFFSLFLILGLNHTSTQNHFSFANEAAL